MKTLISRLFVFMLLISPIFGIAQEVKKDATKQYHLVIKTDGAEYYGEILEDDGREILMLTSTIGKIYINKSEIKSISKLDKDTELTADGGTYKEFRAEGPFTTRYYFTTNAHPIKEKENYALIHLFGPEVHFGVKDNLSLGVMSSWIASPIAVAAKYNLYNKGNTGLAAGSIVGSSGYLLNAQGYFGLHWLTVTKGDRKANVSFSAGYGYANTADAFDLGDQYLINEYEYNPNEPSNVRYPVEPYQAEQAVRTKLYGSKERPIMHQGTVGSVVFGVSGIAPVGKKASFIFDSMIFSGKKNRISYSDKNVSVSWNDSQGSYTGDFTVGEGTLIKDQAYTNIVLMPGMRFSQSHSKAFQVALAGLVHIENGEVNTIPAPMISWLRQF